MTAKTCRVTVHVPAPPGGWASNSGQLVAELSTPLDDTSLQGAQGRWEDGPRIVQLDRAGFAQIVVVCNDAPEVAPQGSTWKLWTVVNGQIGPYVIEPYVISTALASTVDLSALTPASGTNLGGGGAWGASASAKFAGSGSPVGAVTPSAAGDLYVDDTAPALWQANGTANTDWQQVGTSVQINDRGAWTATTAYAKADSYTNGSLRYYVETAYTSGSSFGSTDTTNSIILGAQAVSNGGGFSAFVGDGSTLTYTVTHNMGTKSVNVAVVNQTNNQIVFPTVAVTTLNAVTVTFASAPTTNQMLVLVQPVVTGTPTGGISISSPDASITVGGTSLAPTLKVAAPSASLLAIHGYQPDVSSTSYSTSSATFADVDAANLALTFTTTSSGQGSTQVLIVLSAYGRIDHASAGQMLWGLDDSVAGMLVATQANVISAINATGIVDAQTRMIYRFLLTGLTPSTAYTVKWAWAVSASIGRLFVGNFGAGNVGGQALMEAWAA